MASDNAVLPANAAGVVWHDTPQFEDVALLAERVKVEITTARDQTFREVKATLRSVENFKGLHLISPAEGLLPGARYLFSVGAEQLHADVAEQELSSGVLSMSIAEAQAEVTSVPMDASCSLGVPSVRAAITTELPKDASGRKWETHLLYRTLVNGEPWFHASSNCHYHTPGRSGYWDPDEYVVGRDAVFAKCESDESLIRGRRFNDYFAEYIRGAGLPQGSHRIVMQAFLPGADVMFSSETQTLERSCP